MVVSSKQRADVDQRVEYTCVTNSQQGTYNQTVIINIRAAIRLAFILGARFGLSQPTAAGDFMERWITDHTLDTDAKELGIRHERAMQACVYPLQFTPEDYEHLEPSDGEGNS